MRVVGEESPGPAARVRHHGDAERVGCGERRVGSVPPRQESVRRSGDVSCEQREPLP